MGTADLKVPFLYRARDIQGRLVQGRIEAAGPEEVEQHLDRQGYFPVSVSRETSGRDAGSRLGFLDRIRPVKKDDLIVMTRQISSLLDAGLPIVRGLRIVSGQMSSPKLREAFQDVIDRVESGSALSDAFEAHERIFPPLMISMIRSGEASGKLQEIMDHLGNLLEFEATTEQRVKAATRYPKIVLVSLGAAFLILMTFIVPKFVSMFASQGVELPLPTRILLEMNDLIQTRGLYLLIAAAAGVTLFRKWTRSPGGQRAWDAFRLRWPVMGRLFLLIAMSRFARVLSLLLRSGVPILKACDMVSSGVGNRVVSAGIDQVRDSVEAGAGMAETMRTLKIFPSMLVQMVAVGEETGQLEKMLDKVSQYYDAESEHMIKNLSTYLEPILLLFLGGIVTFLALAIFLPMWNVMELARGGM